MSSPEIVSLQIPYTENEKEFLVLAVQAAIRTFRSISPHRVPVSLSSSNASEAACLSANQQ
jgi:hypothetical protein